MDRKMIARWESRGGAHWVEVFRDEYGYSYKANGAGGFIGSSQEALDLLNLRIAKGDFLPDAAKTPMRQVAV